MDGQGTSPFEVDERGDVPFRVDKDITLMEIGKGEDERPVTVLALGKLRKGCAHYRQGCELLLPIILVVDRIRLVENAIVVTG